MGEDRRNCTKKSPPEECGLSHPSWMRNIKGKGRRSGEVVSQNCRISGLKIWVPGERSSHIGGTEKYRAEDTYMGL